MVSRYLAWPLAARALIWFMAFALPAQAEQELTWLMADRSTEPFQIISDNPEQIPHSGLMTDVLRAMVRDMDISLKVQILPYKRIRHELTSGRSGLWISYGSPVWLENEVSLVGEYSRQPVLEVGYQLVTFGASGKFDMEAVRGKRLLLIHGYTYYAGFHRWMKSMNIQPVFAPSHRLALAMFKQGRADYYLVEEPRLHWHARQMQIDMSQLQMLDFFSIIPTSDITFVFDRRIPEATREQLNQALDNLKESGELDQILEPYR